jgi:WAS/WASL-interacting protein
LQSASLPPSPLLPPPLWPPPLSLPLLSLPFSATPSAPLASSVSPASSVSAAPPAPPAPPSPLVPPGPMAPSAPPAPPSPPAHPAPLAPSASPVPPAPPAPPARPATLTPPAPPAPRAHHPSAVLRHSRPAAHAHWGHARRLLHATMKRPTTSQSHNHVFAASLEDDNDDGCETSRIETHIGSDSGQASHHRRFISAVEIPIARHSSASIASDSDDFQT